MICPRWRRPRTTLRYAVRRDHRAVPPGTDRRRSAMLMAHSAVLSKMLKQYEILRELHADEGTPEAQRRLDDVAYSLCIATGTND
ncbi:MAG TPA: DUF5133 domain-containing protein, partial [Streptomyces sp.]|nr:DUF5133 domain-containing protein [Streptomyces sp.]